MTYAERIERYGRDKVLAQKRLSYRRNAEAHKAAVYRQRAEDPEKWKAYNRAYHKQRHKADPDYYRRKQTKRYGISYEEFLAIVELQSGKCPICCRDLKGNRPCIDHDHATDKVRGVLCNGCNVAIALLKDNADSMLRAATYLARQNGVSH